MTRQVLTNQGYQNLACFSNFINKITKIKKRIKDPEEHSKRKSLVDILKCPFKVVNQSGRRSASARGRGPPACCGNLDAAANK